MSIPFLKASHKVYLQSSILNSISGIAIHQEKIFTIHENTKEVCVHDMDGEFLTSFLFHKSTQDSILSKYTNPILITAADGLIFLISNDAHVVGQVCSLYVYRACDYTPRKTSMKFRRVSSMTNSNGFLYVADNYLWEINYQGDMETKTRYFAPFPIQMSKSQNFFYYAVPRNGIYSGTPTNVGPGDVAKYRISGTNPIALCSTKDWVLCLQESLENPDIKSLYIFTPDLLLKEKVATEYFFPVPANLVQAPERREYHKTRTWTNRMVEVDLVLDKTDLHNVDLIDIILSYVGSLSCHFYMVDVNENSIVHFE